MESVYYVLTYACHRKCRHCYDTRFRPYVRDELKAVVGEGIDNHRRIIANLPDSMTYLDPAHPNADGTPSTRIGRIIMAGGELLIDPVREALFYPAIEAVHEKYGRGGARISMQTTGDVVTPKILGELRERGVWMIAVASLDDYHVGMEGAKRQPFVRESHLDVRECGLHPCARPRKRTRPPHGRWTLLRLFRRPARQMDRRTLAARSRLGKRSLDGDDGNELLLALVGGKEFSEPRDGGIGSRDRTQWRRLSLLP